MNYELAKKLKDIGFYQNRVEAGGINHEILRGEYCADINNPKEQVYIPTLSELIEACGDGFGELNHYRNSGDWECQSKDWTDEQGVGRMSSGKTPKEAVAKLWLELKKKS